jgi:hypothetical protein
MQSHSKRRPAPGPGHITVLAILGIAASLTCAFCVRAAAADDESPTPEVQLRLLFRGTADEDGPFLPMVKSAASATAYRVSPRPDLTAEKSVAGWPVIGEPVTLNGKLVEELSNVLLDAKTYGWEAPPHFCGFSPGVAIRFQGKDADGNERRVVLLICFQCDDVVVCVNEPEPEMKGENITPGRAKLVGFVKRIFPKDKDIQELRETVPRDDAAEELTDEERKQRAAALADKRAEDLFSSEFGVVLNPAKVEAYRIGPDRDPTAPGRLNGHKVLAGPIKVDDKLATEFATALVDGGSYDWELTTESDCSTRPSVVLVFSGDDRGEYTDRVAVYFCFSCDRIIVEFRFGSFGDEASFASARGRFVKLVKQAFPDDRAIQALREDDSAAKGSAEHGDQPK